MSKLRLFAVAAVSLCSAASAQNFPTKPVTVVVPFSAGGPTDTIARIMAERMTKSLGQTVLVENITGAGGNIGVARVVRAAPDGYMVSIGHIGPHVINGAMYQLQYDLLKDLAPVGMFVTNPQIIVSKNGLPSKDLKSLIEYAKSTPISIATGGAGTPSHISGVYFQRLTNGAAPIVHYRGGAPASADLMAGHVDLFFDQAANALPQIRSGKVRAYAVTQGTRLSVAPDIPTVDEAGMPGYYMAVWHALWVPRGTPPAVVARLNSAMVDAAADDHARKRLTDIGQEILPREKQTPEALGAHQKAEIEKWWPIIKSAGIKAD
ncbi:MAG TPA: tripartite tricarboxylate transporter substrate-binding protein [Burkholderiales bacterium]|nr:tripartite tricarboxylate transporter substrate-binding protein [Burkholderiales bacterium]